jgi:CheY-like chemotaxis protein
MKILLVDDDKMWLMLVTKWCRSSDIEIETVDNGFEAIRKLQLNDYDCIVVDLGMPEMSGIKLIDYVITTYTIPIIVLSNFPMYFEMLPEQVRYKFLKPNFKKDLLEIIHSIDYETKRYV